MEMYRQVSAVYERLWLVKKSQCKLIGNRHVIPHYTIPSNLSQHRTTKVNIG